MSKASLTDVLGQTSSVIKAGNVELIVRPLKLGQFAAAQEIILEVLAKGRVEKEISDPNTDQVYKFTDTDLMRGFLQSQDTVERFLTLCVEIKQEEDYLAGPVTFKDLSLGLATQLLQECLKLNEDFFERLLAIIIEVVGKLGDATTKVEAATAKINPVNALANLDQSLDLTQSDQPIGERSPQLFSAPASASRANNSES